MKIVVFEQPLLVTGSVVGIGLGCPKATQNKNARDTVAPITDPVSEAVSVSIPRVKSPNNGPPTTPNIVRPAYNINTNKTFLNEIPTIFYSILMI